MPDNPCGCKPLPEYLHLSEEVDDSACRYAALLKQNVQQEAEIELERTNAELLEACNRFAPVLDWLSSLSENTVGRGLARQIKPFMDKALGKEPDHD